MTTTIAPRRTPASSTQPLDTAPDADMSAPAHDVADTQTPAQPAATFEAASTPAKKYAAFSPPPTPKLVAGDVDGNTAKIEGYNEQREAYLKRYAEAVENPAVTNEQLKRIGPPVAYDNGVNALPVKERKQYDGEAFAPVRLVNAAEVQSKLGSRTFEDKGIKAPGTVDGTFDVRATFLGNGARVKGDTSEGAEVMGGVGASTGLLHGAGSKSAGELMAEAAEKAEEGAKDEAKTIGDVSVTHWIGKDGKSETSYAVKVGAEEGLYSGVESEGKTLMVESGVRGGVKGALEGSAALYTSTDGDSVGAGVKGGLDFHHAELEAFVGANATLLSTEAAKVAIDGKGFFDADESKKKTSAMISGAGR